MPANEEVEVGEGTSYEQWIAAQLDPVPAELGPVVRAARKAEGLSVRELARRAGVSEAQVSRVENGKTLNPNDDTLLGIADALGRSRSALVCLTDSPEANVFSDEVEEVLDDGPAWLRARHEALSRVPASGQPSQALKRLARDLFIQQTLLGPIANVYGKGLDLHEVASSWAGLTDDRRQMCVQFVRDQLRLSELDRRQAARKTNR